VASYELYFKKSAVRELKAIPGADRSRILKVVASLVSEPRPQTSEKLSGNDRFRVRQGDYRVVYSIDDRARIVIVFKIGHRKDVYR
jgi:mRNA interferase RelE/StbE